LFPDSRGRMETSRNN